MGFATCSLDQKTCPDSAVDFHANLKITPFSLCFAISLDNTWEGPVDSTGQINSEVNQKAYWGLLSFVFEEGTLEILFKNANWGGALL